MSEQAGDLAQRLARVLATGSGHPPGPLEAAQGKLLIEALRHDPGLRAALLRELGGKWRSADLDPVHEALGEQVPGQVYVVPAEQPEETT